VTRVAALDPQHPNADLLRTAYRQGVFPMADPRADRIEWFSPDPRGVLPLDGFHIPRSLRRVVRSGRFALRTDTVFEAVMRACAGPRPQEEETWIDDRLIAAYAELHAAGHAHSVEAWADGRLVGGLYGVHLGAAFFGESMFIHPELGGRDASKVCLVALVENMKERGFLLLDTQFTNEHLEQFGCVEIPRDDYLRRLEVALLREADWGEPGPW
jgi:leucyl/phenylalanyl-tRNA--protein transferase